MQPQYHVIEQWRTPASDYPRRQRGDWSITTRAQKAGIYPMQTYGSFYYHAQPIELTVLKEGDKVWFTDEPRQMYALAEIGLFRAYGHVVVGGLGLGLIQHFLRNNPRVESITTLERAAALQTLVWDESEHRCDIGDQLIIGDFYERLIDFKADTIITDFIFGYQNEQTWIELQATRDFCKEHYPDALYLEHGYQRRMDAEYVEASLPQLDSYVRYG